MHGLGNDFVVFDAVRQAIHLDASLVKRIADRHLGIGCDQILIVEAAPDSSVDFSYRIFNSNGNEVEQCGNGARCFMRFVHEQGLTAKRRIRVRTQSGDIEPELKADGSVTVDMGRPEFQPQRIPFASDSSAPVQVLQLDDQVLEISVVSMGNPHAVTVVGDVDTAPVARFGPQIEKHARFPRRVNAGFMQVASAERIKLRVYERDAGETLACGTGACAAVVTGIRRGLLARQVAVDTRGGRLWVEWPHDAANVQMTGPASHVFDGEIDLALWEGLE
jgi:diaminopimelate epimerase